MDKQGELLQAIEIGVVVANLLLKTGRILRAIGLLKEASSLLNNKALETEHELLRSFNIIVHYQMFNSYALINDPTSAIECGTKLLIVLHECGESDKAGAISFKMAELYQSQTEYEKAKALYMKAVNIAIATGERDLEGACYENIGTLFYCVGKYGMAKTYIQKALEIAKEIGNKRRVATSYGNLGTVHKILGDHAKANEYYKEALKIRKEIGDRQGEAADYDNLGTLFHSLGEYGKAEEYLQKALQIRREIGDKRGEAADYGNLGNVFHSLGKHVKAEENLQKALQIRKEIGDKGGEAADYGNLGAVFHSLGEYGKAEVHLRKALQIRKEIGDKRGEAADYSNLGTLFHSIGEHAKAEKCLYKALQIKREIGDKRGEAADYGNLGNVFHSIGEYVKAEEYLQKALQIWVEIGDKRGEAADCGNLGTVFHSLGEYGKAEEYLQKALQIRREIGDKWGEAADYGNLGNVFHSLGKHVKAEENLQKALQIRKEIGDKGGEAADYGNLGAVFHSLGEYGKAEVHLRKALQIRKEIGDKRGEAADYSNLATLFHSIGEHAKAEKCLYKALQIKREIGDKRGEAADYGNLGNVFHSIGEYVKAEEYLQKALQIWVEIGDKRGEAADYGNLGTVFHSLGEYGKAEEYLQKALQIRKEIGDKQGEAADYGNLGKVFHSLGEYVKAKEYHQKACLVTKGISNRRGEAVDDGNQPGTVCHYLGGRSKAKERHGKALDLRYKTGDVKPQLGSHLKLTSGNFELVGENMQGDLTSLFKSIQSCEDMQVNISNFDKHYPSHQMPSTPGNHIKALCVMESARTRALADIISANYSVEEQNSSKQHSWVGIENIMEKESNCVCLYICYYARHLFFWILKSKEAILFRQIEVDGSCSYKEAKRSVEEVFGSANFRFRILPHEKCEDRSMPSSNPDHVVSETSLERNRVPPSRQNQEHELQGLRQCYQMIIAPVVDLLDEPEIIIVPDRALYNVLFAALEDESGKSLSESFRIRIVPSLTTLKLIQDSPRNYHSQTGALIVGDPEVGYVIYMGQTKWKSPLPCARKEAEMIGRLVGTQPLSGKNATKQAVLGNIHSVSLIHFAAHGDVERGEIALAPSCLQDFIPQEEDYLLTMAEILQVRLRAKLVVLSCRHRAARGQIKSEKVVGLARAFIESGARSVLVSLWALEDEATEQLMRRFYKHLVEGESASESLHRTMKWMRSNGFSNVRQWAPFMLIGDNVTFNFKK